MHWLVSCDYFSVSGSDECLIVFLSALVALQRFCLRQQEQPSDEGRCCPAHFQSSRAKPCSVRSPGSGHGQRHLSQVNVKGLGGFRQTVCITLTSMVVIKGPSKYHQLDALMNLPLSIANCAKVIAFVVTWEQIGKTLCKSHDTIEDFDSNPQITVHI